MKKYIMFVDDEPEILQNFKDYFENNDDFIAYTATSATEALLKAQKQVFDVICTDYRMPKMNGSEFISSLRNVKGYEIKPVIVLTGFQEEAQKTCGDLEHVFILLKPVKLASVFEFAKLMSKTAKIS